MTRVLAISDSDSYLKWSAATLRALPASWSSTQVVVKNPVLPSAEQARTAAGRPVSVLAYSALLRRLQRERPDVVLLAASGPVVAALTAAPALRAADRPVLVTGLPGISVPATPRAITLRAGCDLFLLHSHREVAEFTALAAELGVPHTFGLATLPFLAAWPAGRRRPTGRTGRWCSPPRPRCPCAARTGSRSCWPWPRRARRSSSSGPSAPSGRRTTSRGRTRSCTPPWSRTAGLESDALHFAAGPMTEALAGARGLVTVSSTAALEAMAVGLPVLTLSDFGVGAEMINTVFEGSGCLGTLADLRRRPAVSPRTRPGRPPTTSTRRPRTPG